MMLRRLAGRALPRPAYLHVAFPFRVSTAVFRLPTRMLSVTSNVRQAKIRHAVREAAAQDLVKLAKDVEIDSTPLPRRDELPSWAAAMLDDPPHNIADLAKEAVMRNVPTGSFQQSFAVLTIAGLARTICTVLVKIGDTNYRVQTQAVSRDAAETAAWLHLLAKAHALGLAADDSLTSKKFKTPLRGDCDIVDVYRCCARLKALPEIELRRHDATLLYEYTVRLPAKGLQSSGVHADMNIACRRATFAFIRTAHERAAEQGWAELGLDTALFLEPNDARVFLEWLAQKYPLRGNESNVTEQAAGPLAAVGTRVHYRTAPGAPLVSTPVIQAAKRSDELRAAYFHAALSVSWQRPELLTDFMTFVKKQKWKIRKIKAEALALEASETSISSSQDALATANSKLTKPSKLAVSLTLAKPTQLYMSHPSYTLLTQVAPEYSHIIEQGSAEPAGVLDHGRPWLRILGKARSSHSLSLFKGYQTWHLDAPFAIRQTRAALPVTSYKRQLIDLVDSNVYSILVGATGCGKTTQVPQLIFEEWCRRGRGAECMIICTQPRVIAAKSVASRVADELGPKLRDRVGYHVQNEAQVPRPRDGSITFCTTGILLQQLQLSPDMVLGRVSHLLIDEVHERDLILDFTLAVLKRAIASRLERGLTVPKVVLMSATLDEKMFANYFKNVGADGELTPAPSLSVPGRTFPVREKYLDEVLDDMERAHAPERLASFRDTRMYKASEKHIEEELGLSSKNLKTAPRKAQQDNTTRDWNALGEELSTPIALIAETIAHVVHTTDTGAVLVFLPGLKEIRQVEDMLMSDQPPLGIDFTRADRYRLFNLHSSLRNSQRTVFQSVPAGVRKIILSSPVAETSVTIPEVTCVIDSGQVRELQYNNAVRASWLQTSWINASSAKQRAGRAGRVQEGTYLAMYSKARREAMPAVGVPEMMRSDLQSTCLSVKSRIKDVDVPEFLATAIDPPTKDSVEDAMKALVATGAITPEQDITSLGRLLSDFPVHPSLAKMVVMGIIFKCLDPAIIAGAAIEEEDMWVATLDVARQAQESKNKFAEDSQSDLMATYKAYCLLRQNRTSAAEIAEGEYLKYGVFKRIEDIAANIRDKLVQTGLLPAREAGFPNDQIGGAAFNVNSFNPNVVNAVLVAGLQNNLARRMDKKFCLGDRPKAVPATTSLFSPSKSRARVKLVAFGQLTVSNESYILRYMTAVSPLTAALFGGTLTEHMLAKKDKGKTLTQPVLLLNQFLPLPVSVWAEHEADEPDPEQAREVLLQFREALDQVLNLAVDNLARARRGAPVTGEAAAVVAAFVDRVVEVLDTEAYSARMRLREAAMAARDAEERGRQETARAAAGVKASREALARAEEQAAAAAASAAASGKEQPPLSASQSGVAAEDEAAQPGEQSDAAAEPGNGDRDKDKDKDKGLSNAGLVQAMLHAMELVSQSSGKHKVQARTRLKAMTKANPGAAAEAMAQRKADRDSRVRIRAAAKADRLAAQVQRLAERHSISDEVVEQVMGRLKEDLAAKSETG